MAFNKLSVADAVQVKDKRVLLRHVVKTTISVVFRYVLFIAGLTSMYCLMPGKQSPATKGKVLKAGQLIKDINLPFQLQLCFTSDFGKVD